jgi:tRNA (guanine-N7-)-methyltransferase
LQKKVIMGNSTGKIRSYIRRSGRLSSSQARALIELLPLYGCEAEDESPLPLEVLFPEKKELILEIGFGMGEATVEIARQRPECSFIAVEVHKPGVGRLLNEIVKGGLENIRVVHGDADIVINRMLPEASLDGVHLFFPDPWPKKKHHKRWLIQKTFLQELLRVLKPGAYIYAVTDWEEYARWIIEEAAKVPELENPYPESFSPPVPWRPETRFEKKGLDKAHQIWEIWLQVR